MDSLEPGTLLQGRYLIQDALGEAAVGTVYHALDERLDNRPVTVKQAPLRGNEHAFNEFTREAQLLSSLSHPAIVRVCDCFEEDGDAYLVMDFIHGETLASRVTRLPPRVDEVLEWAEQICDALAYLHGQHPPVLMGDLEPGNLLLDERGKIRLFDFGLTRGFDAATAGDTSIPLGVGTAGYAPLEQERGEPCDTRSDLYSLGATIYTLFTGEVPPPAADILGAPGVRELNPEVPQSLDALVRHLTAPDRANRPSSVTVVQRALRGTISSRACPMCGRRVDLPGPCEACRPRPRPLRTTLALAVCMLAIAGALAWWFKPVQPRQFVLLDHAPGLRDMAFSADGKWLVGARDGGSLMVWDASTGQTVKEIPGNVAAVAFAGARLATAGTDGKVRMWDTATWTAADALSAAHHKPNIAALAVSQDTVALLAQNEVQLFDGKTLMATLPDHHVVSLAFAPDGQTLATGDGTVTLWNPKTGQSVGTLQSGHVSALAYSADDTLLASATDMAITLWDTHSRQARRVLTGHSGRVNDLLFEPHGTLVSASAVDHTVRFWNPDSGELLRTLQIQDGPIRVALTQDARSLATCGATQVVLWQFPHSLP